MKTLPEILTKHITDFNIRDSGGMNDTENVKLCNLEATKAIAKELMGIIGEDTQLRDLLGMTVYDQGKQVGKNELRAEQRARLTAFIGTDSNENS